MPLLSASSAKSQQITPLRTGPAFILTIRVCPRTHAIALATVSAVDEPPRPDARPPGTSLYAITLSDGEGLRCDVYVVAEMVREGPSAQDSFVGASAPARRKGPRGPGLCGGVIAPALEADPLSTASHSQRERVERDYQALIEHLRRTTDLRLAQT